MSDEITRLTVDASHVGKRLDRFIVDALPELSRARVRVMLDEGRVRVDGRRARKGDPLREGAVVELQGAAPPADFTPVATPDAPLTVRHEDPALLVVDKPAGQPTHPLKPDEVGTLANALVGRYPETAAVGFRKREPGLLHRLDTDTSGLVLVARTAAAFEALRAAQLSDAITKRYLALVEGEVASDGVVDLPLVPHRKDPKRVEAVTDHVRLRAGTRTHEARTHYRPARAFDGYTLVEVEISRGFRHQIRAHLAAAGHPLVGDTLYRGPALPESLGSLERHFLHASELRLQHPDDGRELRVVSPLPDDLAAVLGRLRSRA